MENDDSLPQDRLLRFQPTSLCISQKSRQSLKTFKIITGLFLVTLVSCGQTIDSDEILKRENNFKLTIHNENDYSSDSLIIKTINKDTEKIAKLI